MDKLSVEQFEGKIDSLYRLVILAAQRAAQISKPDSRPLVPVRSKKPTIVALEEILEGKVKPRIGGGEDEAILE